MSTPGQPNYFAQDFVVGNMETVEPSNQANNNSYPNIQGTQSDSAIPHPYYTPYQLSRPKHYTFNEVYQTQQGQHSEYLNNNEYSPSGKTMNGQAASNISPIVEPQSQPHFQQYQQPHSQLHQVSNQTDSVYSVVYQPAAPVVYNNQQPYGTDSAQGYPSHLLPGQNPSHELRKRNSSKGSRTSSSSSFSKGHSRNSSGSTTTSEYPEPVKPKVATTYWEDAKTVCYQVKARGVLVSRREDTDFVNGTKLLNVMGMTRGKRDGILKTEKIRDVVKVGSMNLKGVWIPFDRAREIARNEGLDVVLYPLFVKDLKAYFKTVGHKLKSDTSNLESPTSPLKDMVPDMPHMEHSVIKHQPEPSLIGELNI